MIEKLINERSLRDKFVKAGIKTVESKFTSEKQLFNFMKMLEDNCTIKTSY